MDNLKFYRIDDTYLNYLKKFDNQVANTVKTGYTKPYCGVVLKFGNFDYYAPLSSFNKKQKTNFLIFDDNNIAISSVRLCFMIPVPDFVLTYIDFSLEDEKYRDLLENEYRYLKKNINDLKTKADYIYKIGSNRNHFLAYTCCDFILLEEKMQAYVNTQKETETAQEQIATTKNQ